MPFIKYVHKKFQGESIFLILQANKILGEYKQQGYVLTLRQLYYQFVARDIIPNNVKSYKRLGSIVNDARLSGCIDWDAIEDRTRAVASVPHWSSPSKIIDSAARSFRIDKWESQRYRPEVWIEKDALASVVERVCTKLDISYLSCRGYTSQSEMWSSAMRLKETVKQGQTPVILHFGDHDPSGIDMSRDIKDRLQVFGVYDDIVFHRMALNLEQIDQYSPPPNPAKQTDTRFEAYEKEFGYKSWELDALEPSVISGLIEEAVDGYRNEEKWKVAVRKEESYRYTLENAAKRWNEVETLLK